MDTNQNLNSYNVNFRANAAKAIRAAFFGGSITRPDALLLWDAKVEAHSQARIMEDHKLPDRRAMVLRREAAWTVVRNLPFPG